MKKLISTVLATLMLTGALAGCGGSSGQSSAAAPANSTPANSTTAAGSEAAGEPLKIGVSMNSADEFRTSLYNAIAANAQSKGYEVIQTNADFDPSKQLSDVESLIQKQPDVIVIFAVDGEAAVAAVEAVKAAGIGCVAVDFHINTDAYDVLIADNQSLHGELQAQYVLDWLNEDESRVANVGYLIGAYMESALERHDGFVNACNNEINSRVNLLSEQCGNWMADDAMAITEDWIQKFPEMNVFVSMNDDMAIGCIQALKAAGRNMDEVLVLGIDGTVNGLEAVRAGELDGTTVVSVEGTAEVVISTCEKIAAGEQFNGSTYEPGMIELVTKANIDTVA
ncbi:sugar ABC transporter substrate-binding protein [Anaerotruncus colihominis]|uniref:sugar ABC transporter substrate-binding protein n=1 Tax=Anaerotruncus colihominis TaxID=169435 RepID=UPI0026EE2D2D|nr:sugar ABC transporter substrate-binding protein [Anaerotruncus colihominis]